VDFELNEDQQMMKDAAREFAEKRLLPNAAKYDEDERLPDELFAELAELGYTGMLIPEEYGGMDLDPISYACIIEEFAAACAGLSITLSVHNTLIGGTILAYGSEELKKKYILAYGSEELKKKYLPRTAAGDIGSYCLTEPGAGSDAAAIRTTAVRDGDSYVINGEKIFATSADYSKLYLVFCLTEPGMESHGISLFLVERDTPGVEVGKKEKPTHAAFRLPTCVSRRAICWGRKMTGTKSRWRGWTTDGWVWPHNRWGSPRQHTPKH